MISVDLIYAGAEKESFYKEAAAEYQKRLQAFCIYHEKAVKEEKLPKDPSDAEITAALKKEGARMLACVPEKAYRIALCVEGKELSSEELSELFTTIPTQGYSQVAFFLGNSDGLSDEVKNACRLKLSMSKMTFPHRLARVMLLEQIYRAFSIASGGKYHK